MNTMNTTQTTYVAFDAQSGRILSVHVGAKDEDAARAALQYLPRLDDGTYAADVQMALIAVPTGAFEHGQRYKIDLGRKTLVLTQEPGGVGCAAGSSGRPG